MIANGDRCYIQPKAGSRNGDSEMFYGKSTRWARQPRIGVRWIASSIILATSFIMSATFAQDWPVHGGDKAGTRYSVLDQINKDNVESLEVAWTYRSGEAERRGAKFALSVDQNIPILAAGNLIVCTPFNRIIALNPATGEENWYFDPNVSMDFAGDAHYACRGVSYWVDDRVHASTKCKHRIIFSTNDLRIFAIDAKTGQRCSDFGDNGEVRTEPDKQQLYRGELRYLMPPAIIGELAVFGSALPDYARADGIRGSVQAFDVRTGQKVWHFEPIPKDADDPAMTSWKDSGAYRTGGGNVWGHMSVDEDRDLVFVPVSSTTADSYGGHRPGNNLYTSSIVALKGSTGQIVWHFQIVHHDLWGWDVAPQPLLVDLMIDGKRVPVVVQNTKQGLIFVFNRETGEPIFPVEERPVPPGDVPGEWYSPTQPFPTRPAPLISPGFGPDDVWGFTLFEKIQCRKKIEGLDHGSLYTPPSLRGTLMFPWSGGGANWGGPAFDPVRQLMIVNISRVVAQVRLIPNRKSAKDEAGTYSPMGTSVAPMAGTPYAVEKSFIESPFGVPCNAPPWGELVAIDLADNSIKWRVPLGSLKRLLPIPIPLQMGVPNIGGPIVTAGGLVFIAATIDQTFRAFDVDTGDKLWEVELPAGSQTAPISYQSGARQFVVITSGGHAELGNTRGDYVVAYSLPH